MKRIITLAIVGIFSATVAFATTDDDRANVVELSCNNEVLTLSREVITQYNKILSNTWGTYKETREFTVDGIFKGYFPPSPYVDTQFGTFYFHPDVPILFENNNTTGYNIYLVDKEKKSNNGLDCLGNYNLNKKLNENVCSSHKTQFSNGSQSGMFSPGFLWFKTSEPGYVDVINKNLYAPGVPSEPIEIIRYFLKNRDKLAVLEADYRALLADNQAKQTKQIIDAKNKVIDEQNRKQAEQDKYLATNGKGFIYSVDEIETLTNHIFKISPVKDFMRYIKQAAGKSGMQDGGAVGACQALEMAYPGTKLSLFSNSGKIVYGTETIDFNKGKLLRYELTADNGLHYIYTFSDPIITVKATDGTSMILAKINISEPGKSRISDATLPINAMNTITQVYQKKGISVSEKMLLTMLEDWYKAELMLSGKTLQNTMTGLLIDVDTRSAFLKYAKAQAKVAVKPVGDDE